MPRHLGSGHFQRRSLARDDILMYRRGPFAESARLSPHAMWSLWRGGKTPRRFETAICATSHSSKSRTFHDSGLLMITHAGYASFCRLAPSRFSALAPELAHMRPGPLEPGSWLLTRFRARDEPRMSSTGALSFFSFLFEVTPSRGAEDPFAPLSSRCGPSSAPCWYPGLPGVERPGVYSQGSRKPRR